MSDIAATVAFVNQATGDVEWRTPSIGPLQPIPRVGERVQFGNDIQCGRCGVTWQVPRQ